MGGARPTLRCLRGDLQLPVPPIHEPLDEIDHPLLVKVGEQFAHKNAPRERLRAIDDTILFKVKISRWRGAVWVEPGQPWLVAAGWREQGSTDDFYAALEAEGKAARAGYNADHKPPMTSATYTAYLLPTAEDRERAAAAAAASLEQSQGEGPSPARRTRRGLCPGG